jgi:PknH-like extracellular domain
LFRHALAVLAATIAVAGCSSGASTTTHTPKPLPASALDGLLPSVADVSAVMGTAMTPHKSFSTTSDHRDLLPNLNCLGIWQIGERAIYGPSGFTAIRGQVLRAPDTEIWNSFVMQAVALYPSADAARKFVAASAERWSNCSNHRVNMIATGLTQTTFLFGALTKTDTELTMPVNSTGAGGRSCQRALGVDNNVIVDVAACGLTIGNQASSLVTNIEGRIPK